MDIDDARVRKAFDRYQNMRKEVYGARNKPMCLMDLGTMGGKYLKKTGVLKNLDESEDVYKRQGHCHRPF